MLLEDYLALLSWQGCRVFLRDFDSLKKNKIKSPEQIKNFLFDPISQTYLIHHPNWWRRAEEDYDLCKKNNYHIIWPYHRDYPKSFLYLESPPPILSYEGNLKQPNDSFYMTIVGSRKSNQEVLSWMDLYFSEIVIEKNIVIVSGGARGIDRKSHEIAIRLKKPTICFLPSGLSNFYPNTLYDIKKDILDYGGAFITSFHPKLSIHKSFFHIRNRFMARYADLVFVMQASLRSGTMLTAKNAMNYGIPLATLSGSSLNPLFSGNLSLIYDGAFLVRDDKDLSLLIESSDQKIKH